MLTTFASLACPGHELWGGRCHVAAELGNLSAAPDWALGAAVTSKVFSPGKPRLALTGFGVNEFLFKQLSRGVPGLEGGLERQWMFFHGWYTHPGAVKPAHSAYPE